MLKKVYFIFQEGDDDRCKIGKSKDPSKRVKQLQTGNPDKLYVYKTFDGYTKEESELHQLFADVRIPGTEWFNLSKSQVDSFMNNNVQSLENSINTCIISSTIDNHVTTFLNTLLSFLKCFNKSPKGIKFTILISSFMKFYRAAVIDRAFSRADALKFLQENDYICGNRVLIDPRSFNFNDWPFADYSSEEYISIALLGDRSNSAF